MYPRKDLLIDFLYDFLKHVLKPGRGEREALRLFPEFLEDRFGDYAREHTVRGGGRVDFRIAGPNPVIVELVVRTETLPGTLYGSQNVRELQKLSAEPQTRAKMRYLLLLDNCRASMDLEGLWPTYAKIRPPRAANPVCIVYVHREFHDSFLWH